MIDGLLVVNKPKGCTSHDVINRIRKIYNIKKCGHAGTLDPMAQGVLLVFMGKALKLLSYLEREELDKTYLMRVTLGVETESYDTEGQVISCNDEAAFKITSEQIQEAINSFKGNIEQIPPIYSAVRVNGEKAYKKARMGEEVTLSARPVTIKRLDLLHDFTLNGHRQLIIRVDCSRGTYVRSLAHDIGRKLGCGAHLSYLRRERVGKCQVSMAYPWYNIINGKEFVNSNSFVTVKNILNLPKAVVTKDGEIKVSHGNAIFKRDLLSVDLPENVDKANLDIILITNEKDDLLAIYKASKDKKGNLILLAEKVFSNEH